MSNHLLSKHTSPRETSLLPAEAAGLHGSVHSVFSFSGYRITLIFLKNSLLVLYFLFVGRYREWIARYYSDT